MGKMLLENWGEKKTGWERGVRSRLNLTKEYFKQISRKQFQIKTNKQKKT